MTGAPAPVLKISAITHRKKPIYHAINGYGRETIMLRKYVLEASLLKVLGAAVPCAQLTENKALVKAWPGVVEAAIRLLTAVPGVELVDLGLLQGPDRHAL